VTIKAAQRLSALDWREMDLVLREFGVPLDASEASDHYGYALSCLGKAEDKSTPGPI
jgi:hypothetical protein